MDFTYEAFASSMLAVYKEALNNSEKSVKLGAKGRLR
jgi:hypothetical protein